MGIFTTLRTSASALTAERLRMDVIANNIANARTTRATDGEAYQRERVVFRPIEGWPGAAGGVAVAAVVEDQRPGQLVHDPSHPDADADGNVTYPNVDITTELVDMMSATRAYEANVVALQASKTMAAQALSIAQG